MKDAVLVLVPHPDDCELGCGGTIARFIEEGKDVYCVLFSRCAEAVPEGSPEDIRSNEFKAAMNSYSLPEDHVIILDYPVRRFNSYRQEILDDVIRIGRQIEPGYVFSPSLNDIHQDHHVIAEEALRAFKRTTLLAYEAPWNNLTFNNQAFIKIEKRHLDQKMDAIALYDSQRDRPYMSPDFIMGQAKIRGVQAGCEFAEMFEIVRWIL